LYEGEYYDFAVARAYYTMFYAASALLEGGLNFKRKKFLSTIFLMLAGELDFIVVAHKDRLCRFAFEFIEELAAANGYEILVANQESTSAQQELVEDLLAVVHCFFCRLYGLRSYIKKVK
jgi:putative resolvase